MLTNIKIRNFKQFDEVEIELGQTVVLIGPNNSGKTTVLQALVLWYLGVQTLREKGASGFSDAFSDDFKPFSTTINRNDMIATPIPDTKQLWRDLRVRNHERIEIEVRRGNYRPFRVVLSVKVCIP